MSRSRPQYTPCIKWNNQYTLQCAHAHINSAENIDRESFWNCSTRTRKFRMQFSCLYTQHYSTEQKQGSRKIPKAPETKRPEEHTSRNIELGTGARRHSDIVSPKQIVFVLCSSSAAVPSPFSGHNSEHASVFDATTSKMLNALHTRKPFEYPFKTVFRPCSGVHVPCLGRAQLFS